ncbi:MAG: hypothetical protein MUE91_09925, partial [Ignavibacteriaceae bacterium]|nr:hypothetical protein [Ignavibacteriaceae bacterium]
MDEFNNIIKKSELSHHINSKREIGSVESFCKTRDGFIWIATTVGLCKFNLSANELELYQPIPVSKDIVANQLNSLTEDKEGNFWAGTTIEGLIKFDPKNGKFFRYKNYPDDHNSLAFNGVLTVYTDRSGILWIGYWTGGISKWDKQKWKFPLYKISSKGDNVLDINNVNTIYEDKNRNLWVGTQRGLYKYDQDKYFSKFYKRNPNNTHSLSCDSVTYILGDSFNSSVLWVGTENGLNEFNTETEHFSHYFYSTKHTAGISENYIKCLLIDHKGLLWIGTRGGGLIKYDKKTGNFIRFLNDPNKEIIIGNNYVHCIYEDYAGNIWFGHDDHGLSKYDRKSGNFTNYNTENFFAARTFYENKNKKMWIGTYQDGIYLFDQLKNDIISHFTIENGLRDNQINTLLEDSLGNLWIASFSGLTRYSPINGFKYYSVSEGIASVPGIVGRNLYRGISGNIYYCGKEGFNAFNPNEIIDDSTPPHVLIKKVSLFNRTEEKIEYDGFISELKELSLSYNQNDLSFQYVGLHYGEPLKNQYKYILEGFDKNWNDAGNLRTATYTNLDPGTYIFRVKASNRDGIWNVKGASIKIIINPPIWATTWAYLLYIILTISLIYFLWKLNVRRIRTKHEYEMSKFEAEKLHEVDELKSRFFANISHEFRTPLTLILGPAKDVIESTKELKTKQDVGLIKGNAIRLLGLVNQLLDLSKLEAG